MNREDLLKKIWEISTATRGVIFVENYSIYTLKLIFIKYMIDNNGLGSCPDDMKTCMSVLKSVMTRDAETGMSNIYKLLGDICIKKNAGDVFNGELEDVKTTLFGGSEAMKLKSTASKSLYDTVINNWMSMELEDDQTHSVGKAIVDIFIDLMEKESEKSRWSQIYTTPVSLSKLVSGILNVSENDIFADITAGTGISTLSIVGNTNAKIRHYDIYSRNNMVALMLYVLYGYDDISVVTADTLSDDYTKRIVYQLGANKIFIDPPIREKNIHSKLDSNLKVLDIIHNLRGLFQDAVVTAPTNVLSNSRGVARDLRKELIESGRIKAIITLPPLWTNIGIHSNLIVFSNTVYDKVIMIDYSDIVIGKRGRYILSDADIERIISVLNSDDDTDLSARVSISSILQNECDLTPNKYIVKKRIYCDGETLEEIDKKIENLYNQLWQQQY